MSLLTPSPIRSQPENSDGSPPASPLEIQEAFFARMGVSNQFRVLFEHLPDVYFFAKDADGRFVAFGRAMLLRLGFASEEEIIGKTDADIHPPRVVREVRADDLRVMATGEPIIDRVETLYSRSHLNGWYVTTKLPIRATTGEVIGIMGFVRPYRRDENSVPGAERLARVVGHIRAHHGEGLDVQALARMAGLSVRQLHRLFRGVFGMSTQTFIVRTRVQAASDDLLFSDKPLSEIAEEHGFCDQSAFSRRFAEHTGETPLKFRRRQRPNGTRAVTS